MFRAALDSEYIPRSPAAKLKVLKDSQHSMRFLELAKKFGVGQTFLVAQIGVIRGNPDLVTHGLARNLVKQKERRFRGQA